MTVRAFYEAAKVESAQSPYDTVHLKIFSIQPRCPEAIWKRTWELCLLT